MSTQAAASEAAKTPAKGKKLILIVAAVVVALLVAAGATMAWVVSSRASADEYGDEEVQKKAAPAVVPTFLPMDTLVVNLADAGGERFAQIGITLELEDSKTSDLVKQHMPSIRSGVLMLVSQRTSDELLSREGKEKLAADILQEVARPLGFKGAAEARREGGDSDDERRSAKRRKEAAHPVRQVLFSSFIIQ
ncbi:flagellar basal body protein FliL [Acidovorax sp. SRB_14]|uniref:flagellar basal body-associated FliL family protein n=1 Tax=unclassified Acidovorax TaxID=2684926 RepID=UPI0019823CBA|nr:flagellar basal body protein FliL [Acidovorax sp. SRB_24]NMM82251.1 flagellar basal body protein FliL [Acidovorax sp. SRB_14]NMM85428.1 flagellar basal body protein FliL [Rhodococcus sp. SRB_17]